MSLINLLISGQKNILNNSHLVRYMTERCNEKTRNILINNVLRVYLVAGAALLIFLIVSCYFPFYMLLARYKAVLFPCACQERGRNRIFMSEICQKCLYLNVASFGFYLDNINKYGKSSTRALSVYINITTDAGERIRLRTPLQVRPKYWDPKKQKAKHASNAIEINIEMDRLEKLAFDVCLQYRALPADGIKKQLKAAFFGKKVDNSFAAVYKDFVAERMQVLASRTIAKYKTLISAIMEYNPAVTFAGIDMSFYDGFTQALRSRGLLDDTIAKYISNLKTFMRWAARRGHHSNYEFDHFRAPRLPKVEIITLKEDEVQQLEKYTPDSKRLERVRDLFMFLLYTGQRISDAMTFDRNQIMCDRWVFEAEKTKRKKKVIVVPFAGYTLPALAILKKYDYKLPVISEQKFNDYLKELGRLAGLTREVSKRRFRGSEEIVMRGPLWQFISSHTARRTCITLLIRKGVPLPVIQKLTGHSDVKTLMKYENTDVDDLAEALKIIS